MNISPKDILEKEFAKKFNGYDPEQVDEFLDDVIRQFESLMEENENILAKNEALKSELSRYKAKADKLENIEEKLMAAVVTAQRNATAYIEKAEAQAQKIISIANQNARTVIESTQLRMENAQQELKRHERLIQEYKLKFKKFLDEQYAAFQGDVAKETDLSGHAAEISKSINNLSGGLHEPEESRYRLDDILKISNDETESLKRSREEAEYDFRQSTANLQQIVNEIIDD